MDFVVNPAHMTRLRSASVKNGIRAYSPGRRAKRCYWEAAETCHGNTSIVQDSCDQLKQRYRGCGPVETGSNLQKRDLCITVNVGQFFSYKTTVHYIHE